MVVRSGGSHTKFYVLLFICQEKSEFIQEKVRKIYRQSCVGTLFRLLALFQLLHSSYLPTRN